VLKEHSRKYFYEKVKIPKEQSEAVKHRRTDNIVTKREWEIEKNTTQTSKD
jgi:hypothetical protein